MTKNDDAIIDWRSTGRRKARRALFESFTPFACAVCGKTSIEPPKDAPSWFEEIWPEENRVLAYSLQADHLTKNLQNNSAEDLEWKCSPCHKASDSLTEKGESTIDKGLW
jgi:aconitase A